MDRNGEPNDTIMNTNRGNLNVLDRILTLPDGSNSSQHMQKGGVKGYPIEKW